MAKPKYTAQFKISVAKAYLTEEGSRRSLARKYGVGQKSVEDWARKYREHGEDGFLSHPGNSKYSSEFKYRCVEAVLRGEGSAADIVAKYNISSSWVLRDWIKRYTANRELKDYDPIREVYMADARRKQRWKIEKRLRSTVFLMTKITRGQLHFMLFHTVCVSRHSI